MIFEYTINSNQNIDGKSFGIEFLTCKLTFINNTLMKIHLV